jgi:putative ABC transport system substrate-binding protein
MRSRRQLLLLAGGVLTAPRLTFAQQEDQKIYRVGFLGTGFVSGYLRELEWIREGLRKVGLVEGKNIAIEYRWAEGKPERSREIAREFVALKVDAILVHGLPGALAAARETSTIPIVMADGGDPIAAGLGASVARPGRNITGSFSFVVEEIGKRLQLLKEAQPGMKKGAWLASTVDFALDAKRTTLRAAAASMSVEVQEFLIREAADLPGTFNAMTKAGADGALINNEPLLNSHASTIAALAAAMRLPSAGYATFADAGGLLAYGANRPALYTRVGYFVDRIFKGAKPGDLPFERAARFDVIVNLKTAKALGVTVPGSILARADRVIE